MDGGASWYPAPEMLLGQAYYEPADWWRLGYILYEMLIGMPPFYSEDDDQALRNITLGALDLPGSLSPPARDILPMLLRHSPGERLGANGPSEIEAHPFSSSIDWEKLKGVNMSHISNLAALRRSLEIRHLHLCQSGICS